MGINKGVEREILVELVDVAAQLQTVFIPVKNDAANSRVMFDKLQQVDAILRPDNLKPCCCSARSSSLMGSSL
jgi:hypothetical protein